jgi:hypothetical protein
MFGQIAVAAIVGFGFAILRRRKGPVVPEAQKEPFVASARMTTAALTLDPRVPAEEAGFDVTDEEITNAGQ